MQIIMRSPYAGPLGSASAGELSPDMPDDVARAIVKMGHAYHVGEVPTVESNPDGLDDPPQDDPAVITTRRGKAKASVAGDSSPSVTPPAATPSATLPVTPPAPSPSVTPPAGK